MSFTYRFEPGLLLVFGEGFITQDERIEVMRAWMADPNYHPGLDTLCDLSKAESTPTLSELRAIVEFFSRRASAIGRKKLAIVAAKEFTFGVARQFAGLTESGPVEVRVFPSRESARSWLGPPIPDS